MKKLTFQRLKRIQMRLISQKFTFFWGFSLFLLIGCTEQSYEESQKQRMQIASTSKDGTPVVIGVAWKSADSDLFIKGLNLAVKEVNQKGGVFGGELKVVIDDSESNFNNSQFSTNKRNTSIYKIANSFAQNPNLIAVVGHSSSGTASLASVIYENNGILFLATNAKYSKLTGHHFTYTFRTASSNIETGKQLADYIGQNGYKNIAILSSRDESPIELMNVFEAQLISKYSTKIAYRSSFFDNTADITSIIVDLKNIQKLDAVFISATSKTTTKIYQQIRKMDVNVPIIGGDSLDSRDFSDTVKEWESSPDAKKSIIPTLFNRESVSGIEFTKQFNQEYGNKVKPDYLAALGYDTINVLVRAILLTQSTVPIEIATTLRYMKPCIGAAGKYEFKESGDLKSKQFYFKHWDNDHYSYEKTQGIQVDDTDIELCNEVDKDLDSIPNTEDKCPNTSVEDRAKVMTKGVNRGCIDDSKQQSNTNN